MNTPLGTDKEAVHAFWNYAACGEALYLPTSDRAGYQRHSEMRYQLEPFILDFASFQSTKGKRVLEVGVGLGADHQCFAAAGANLYGIDLTERAVEHTRNRLNAFGLHSELAVGDAERLDFPDGFFDVVYSWGVLHHSPDTARAISEVYRVLSRGGVARIMIYHKWSLVGLMLWTRYALLSFRPWRSLTSIYASHLESPGTKAYSVAEARRLFSAFSGVRISTVLGHGDLLTSQAGQRHGGWALTVARRLWPRRFLARFARRFGLAMLIEATK